MTVQLAREKVLEVGIRTRRNTSTMEVGQVRYICTIFRNVLKQQQQQQQPLVEISGKIRQELTGTNLQDFCRKFLQ